MSSEQIQRLYVLDYIVAADLELDDVIHLAGFRAYLRLKAWQGVAANAGPVLGRIGLGPIHFC